MKNRVLTIQIEIEDKEQAAWIWHSHLHYKPEHGVIVQVIQEGEIGEYADD